MGLEKIEARDAEADLELLTARLLEELGDDNVARIDRFGGGTNIVVGEENLRAILGRAWMMGARVVMNTMATRQPCRICGCWELEACDEGCGWAEIGLCTACAEGE
ncbi:MAG: hypothetical protein V4466_12090 [Pseudomonadota bacterium]